MKDNKHGWWGILRDATFWSLGGLVITAVVFAFLDGAAAVASVAVAGLAVVVLSALTIIAIALVWRRNRDAAIPLAMGIFILKIVLFGLALTVIPAPAWLETLPAAIAAIVAIVLWQAGEVLAFARTRHQLYNV
ncbi:MAG: hypothetical protein ACTHZ5_07525 [Micrococcaceae bacterium]